MYIYMHTYFMMSERVCERAPFRKATGGFFESLGDTRMRKANLLLISSCLRLLHTPVFIVVVTVFVHVEVL